MQKRTCPAIAVPDPGSVGRLLACQLAENVTLRSILRLAFRNKYPFRGMKLTSDNRMEMII